MHDMLRPMLWAQHAREADMVNGILARKIAVIAALAALSALMAGCVSDMTAPTADSGTHQLRYFGGPKYPTWMSQ
jgi:hypothetical protein